MTIVLKKEISLEHPPDVPMQLLQKVESALMHARALSVVHVCEGKQTTLNSFRLNSSSGPRPQQSAAEVAQAVADVMQAEALRLMDKGDHDLVASGLACVVKVARFEGQREKTFRYSWKLYEEAPGDEESVFGREDIQEGGHVYLNGIIERQDNMLDRLMAAKENSDAMILDMAERSQMGADMVAQQLSFAQGVSMQGMNSMIVALQTTFSHESVREAEAAKSARWERMLTAATKHFGPAVTIGAQQLMRYMGHKINGTTGPTGRPPKRGSGAPGPAPGPAQPPPHEDPSPPAPEQPADALYECVAAFSGSLAPAQHTMLRKTFQGDALDAFYLLLGSTTGKEVAGRFAELEKMLGGDMALLMSAVAELEEEQQQLVMHVVAAVKGAADEP